MFDHATPRKLRSDIQVLRAIAVLAVLLYHARLESLAGGYLGVDVFFVISGYLMTRMITEKLKKGEFTFRDFYFRRAKRLLPAAYATFLGTALLAPFVLNGSGLADFKAQLAGSLGFVANIVLWRQTGYFQSDAEMQPLLHVWSLSLEEQYYFALPALLFLTPKRYWKPTALILVAASALLCFLMVTKKPSATFYLLPTRAWELGVGSFGALIIVGPIAERVVKVAFWPSAFILVGVLAFPLGRYHPGIDAALVCVATMAIIWRDHPIFRAKLPGTSALEKVGDISYSLYLVHWPLLALLNNVWVGPVDQGSILAWRIGLLVLSVVLALLLNRYVEEPLRRIEMSHASRFAKQAAVSSFCLLVLGLGLSYANAGNQDDSFERRPNHGIGPQCNVSDGEFDVVDVCRTRPAPKVMVWGDSYAMALVPGLGATFADEGVVQATKDACGPLRGIAVFAPGNGHTLDRAEDCIKFNESVLEFLNSTDSVETVVLSSPLQYYVEGSLSLVSKVGPGGPVFESPSRQIVADALSRTISAIRLAGKRVVVVAPPPTSGINIGHCQERLGAGQWFLGVSDCSIPLSVYRKRGVAVADILATVSRIANVHVISFDPYLCGGESCKTAIDGIPLYRDEGHLSYRGSVALARGIKLKSLIDSEAR